MQDVGFVHFFVKGFLSVARGGKRSWGRGVGCGAGEGVVGDFFGQALRYAFVSVMSRVKDTASVRELAQRCKLSVFFISALLHKFFGAAPLDRSKVRYADAVTALQEEIAKDPSKWAFPEVEFGTDLQVCACACACARASACVRV